VNSESQTPVELRSLIGHREFVAAGAPLEDAHRRFAATGRDFLAVLDGDRLLGVCARREIAMQLGARFGFALFARSPVRVHLMAEPLVLSETSPLPQALASVAARSDESFYDDVLLVDLAGGFIGFIFVHALVRLQTGLLLGNISALERSRQEVAEKNKVMEDDLLMAREVQLAMLPSGAGGDPRVRWRFHSRYAPAGGVSGDFFQLLPISDAAAGVLVCDVMGHGVRSALVTAMIRAFSEDLRPRARDPGALLSRLNQGLMGVLRQAGNLLFVTAAYAVVDAAAGTVLYGQAGHPTGLIRRASGAVDLMPAGDDVAGPAFGLIDDFAYECGCGRLDPGDAALLFTDGVFEARNPGGEEWGQERLRSEVSLHPALQGEDLLAAVVSAAGSFASGGPFEDDVCIVSLALESRTDAQGPPGAGSGS
jgi:serine phosphatase RsbU (regulator of sigma subunit)